MTLPTLRLNRQFVDDFVAASAPCFAMGVVEESGKRYAFLALRPVEEIPGDVTFNGFNFGHSVLEISRNEVVHFAFEFYGYKIFNVLINPRYPVAKTILSMMVKQREYFFFAINPSGSVTAFKSEIGNSELTGVISNLERIMASTTSDEQYERSLAAFSDKPTPVGPMLHWVCRDNESYLDLSSKIIELNPA